MYGCFAYTCMCAAPAYLALGGQKKMADPLELELRVVVRFSEELQVFLTADPSLQLKY